MTKWESIEEWAVAHGLTLDDALDAGVSQDDDGTIHIPDATWDRMKDVASHTITYTEPDYDPS